MFVSISVLAQAVLRTSRNRNVAQSQRHSLGLKYLRMTTSAFIGWVAARRLQDDLIYSLLYIAKGCPKFF